MEEHVPTLAEIRLLDQAYVQVPLFATHFEEILRRLLPKSCRRTFAGIRELLDFHAPILSNYDLMCESNTTRNDIIHALRRKRFDDWIKARDAFDSEIEFLFRKYPTELKDLRDELSGTSTPVTIRVPTIVGDGEARQFIGYSKLKGAPCPECGLIVVLSDRMFAELATTPFLICPHCKKAMACSNPKLPSFARLSELVPTYYVRGLPPATFESDITWALTRANWRVFSVFVGRDKKGHPFSCGLVQGYSGWRPTDYHVLWPVRLGRGRFFVESYSGQKLDEISSTSSGLMYREPREPDHAIDMWESRTKKHYCYCGDRAAIKCNECGECYCVDSTGFDYSSRLCGGCNGSRREILKATLSEELRKWALLGYQKLIAMMGDGRVHHHSSGDLADGNAISIRLSDQTTHDVRLSISIRDSRGQEISGDALVRSEPSTESSASREGVEQPATLGWQAPRSTKPRPRPDDPDLVQPSVYPESSEISQKGAPRSQWLGVIPPPKRFDASTLFSKKPGSNPGTQGQPSSPDSSTKEEGDLKNHT